MRRVLVLAYYFPPLGGAGVQRTVKLLKHLPSLGYEALVLTGAESGTVEASPPDRTLMNDVPPTTVVHRLGREPAALGTWGSRTRRWLGRTTPFARWWVDGAIAAARELRESFDVVYASLSPFEGAEAARRIASDAGVPWIADLRDPWALDEWTVYPTRLHRMHDERRMRACLGDAAAVIANTPEAATELRRRFPGLAARVFTIPNGWDASDFAPPLRGRTDGAFRIVYAGYSHVERGLRHRRTRRLRAALGGATKGLDVLARSHLPLVRAVESLRAVEPNLASRVEVHLAGAAPSAMADGTAVVHHGYLEHDRAVALIRSADLLFLPMHDLPPGVRARTVPGKTYEYLASGRPILAAVPDGDARDLLTGLPGVRVCRPWEIACLTEALRHFMTEPVEDAGRSDAAAAFERERLAAQIAEVFDVAIVNSSERS